MRSIRSVFVLSVVALVAIATAVPAFAASDGEIRRAGMRIPGSYIVVLADDARGAPAAVAADLSRRHGATTRAVYGSALRGFSAVMTEAAARAISRDPRVAFVEEDGLHRVVDTQVNPVWGLDRIDQRDLPLNSAYTYNASGVGVTAYVIDTGIRITHNDFGGRASYGTDTVDNDSNADDCHGHGTHVAGTLGGTTYGVAKGVSLVAVRVLDCLGFGSTSDIVDGIDWVTGHHVGGPAVANMSLGGGASSSIDTAVRNSINDGIVYSLAAGNGDFFGRPLDACTQSPARVTEALTVSATNSSDSRVSWANTGTCVDLFAPGVSITSAWSSSDSATNTISGTSMSAPHVAGVAAQYLETDPGAAVTTVNAAIVNNATAGKVPNPGAGTPNLLLYNGFIGGGGPPANQPPTAAFTSSCTDLSCTFDATGSSDSDGTITSYGWTFGDGGTGSGATPAHSYAAAGTYSVTLTVTDDDGATDTETQNVTVSEGGGGGDITLTASRARVGREIHVTLDWTGSTPGGTVDVFRNGTYLTTTADDGQYVDVITQKLRGTQTYQVCETDTGICSNEANVNF